MTREIHCLTCPERPLLPDRESARRHLEEHGVIDVLTQEARVLSEGHLDSRDDYTDFVIAAYLTDAGSEVRIQVETTTPRRVDKVAYVREQAQGPAGNHHCHWPGCETLVPPAQWGCRTHWYQLPEPLRKRIWRAYKPGQEISKTPSREYVQVAREVQVWIQQHAPARPPAPEPTLFETAKGHDA